jgi:hypothetical protein
MKNTQSTQTQTTPFTGMTNAPAEKWRDPFVDEIHQIRAHLLAKANGDMHQLVVNAHNTALALGFETKPHSAGIKPAAVVSEPLKK